MARWEIVREITVRSTQFVEAETASDAIAASDRIGVDVAIRPPRRALTRRWRLPKAIRAQVVAERVQAMARPGYGADALHVHIGRK